MQPVETGARHREVLLPFAIIWSVFVLGVSEWFAGGGLAYRPFSLLADPRVGPAGFGALAVHAILCEDDRRKRVVLRMGIVLELVRGCVLLFYGVQADVVGFSLGYGFFAATLIDLLYHSEWRTAALSSLLPIGMLAAPLGLAGVVRRLTPLTYDGALLALDSVFRLPFSALLAGALLRAPVLRAFAMIAYAALPAAIAAGLAYDEYNIQRSRQRGVGVNLLLAYMFSGTIAAALYVACPATGPYYAFPERFPFNLPNSSAVQLTLGRFADLAPRNAMPSFHFAWTLLLARSTAGARAAIQCAAWLLVILIVVATVGTGEHYMFDLFAAVPMVVALEGFTARRQIGALIRIRAIVFGSALYAGCILCVRHAASIVPYLASRPDISWVMLTSMLASCFLAGLRRTKRAIK